MKQLKYEQHRDIQSTLRDLNNLYRTLPALHQLDFSLEGFDWVDCHDADNSVISYLRYARDRSFVLVVLNFTPVPRTHYRVGVPERGTYREIFNSDSYHYGGGNLGNLGSIDATDQPWMGRSHSIVVTLPPLAGVIEIEHGRHRINPKSVEVEFGEPIMRARQEKRFHLISAVIENTRAPILMQPQTGIFMFIQCATVESREGKRILGKVRRHPVENDAYAFPMTGVNKRFQVIR